MTERPLRVRSLCAGVGGIDLAFERAGCRTIGLVEWDKACQRVLRRHFPNAQLNSDLKEFHGKQGSAEVVIGGTPCQDLSVAGQRRGLEGARSSLFYHFARVVDETKPEWFVWENVAGALTSGGGRDMGAVLGTMADLGYGFAYRVLDAQFFGVAQQRRRVVVVGRRRNVSGPAQVLALGQGIGGNPPARDPAKSHAAIAASHSLDGRGIPSRDVTTTIKRSLAYGADDNDAQGGQLVVTTRDVAPSLMAHARRNDPSMETYLATYRKVHRAQTKEDFETWQEDTRANTINVFDQGETRATTLVVDPDSYGVRRLTPRECERLNGFPDDWTRWDDKGKELADSPRYKMMGNSVAVPVFEWVARRLVAVHNAG